MYKLLFLFCSLVVLACTNQSSPSANEKDSATKATTTAGDKVALNADAMSYISPCVESAKTLYGEQEAFSLCKCLYGQVQQKYPNADSATLSQHMQDTTEVKQMIAQCK